MQLRATIGLSLLLCVPTLSPQLHAQDSRGRKYKAPPETAHIEVEVLKNSNGKPIANAAVVFNPAKDGKDEGSLEVKTDPDGKAAIDVIPVGSTVTLQVIAGGYATYALEFTATADLKPISVKMLRPRAQVSTYVDNSGKPAQLPPGVMEPHHVAPPPAPATPPPPANPPATPPASTPPAQ